MNGFWMGHRMLGDVLGFCAAAHLYAVKIGQPVKVWFDPTRIDACEYFGGVVWVPRDEIPAAIDCGADPTPEEWPSMNGVKRFYRFMDPTMQPSSSFDVHFSKVRAAVAGPKSEKLIGLITHSNTQGEIDEESLSEMLKEARHLFPNHRIGCLGNMDNRNVPQGVEDWRQARGDVKWIIDYVAKLDLLITPQSGPCFIAAGWRVPMWVYRSRESFWDWTLNYETYQVERWWDRKATEVFAIFDRIYQHGGWNGLGSGPGSAVEVNREYIEFLNHLIQQSPTITTILDIGCGDWQIMGCVDLSGKQYLGIDVVASVVEKNNRGFGTHSVGFQVLNPCRTEIPYADLIIMKDVIQHLPGVHVQRILEQIKHRCKFAVIANDYTPVNSLHEISIGEWKPINVLSPPFSLPGCTVGIWNGKHVTLSSFPDGDQSSARQASPVANGEINSLLELLTPRALPGDLVTP
ncbi:MAG: class I SAM-dependent methyltransferase [Planctomycetales bacterium]|nr:class I SAM-dependent methyltransferase [Planctomycetales bacterium]